jgi:hypothetical protein
VITDEIRALPYRHLIRMTTERGVYEHAREDAPRAHHGYCTDDVARALTVVMREPAQLPELERLREIYLRFVEAAVTPGGRVANRMSRTGRWMDEPAIGDWWGRAVAALGFTAAHATAPTHRARALRSFLRAARQRSTDVRASAFAALGAAEVLRADPTSAEARSLLEDCLAVIPIEPSVAWTWPERRLRYANGALCEALIVGGDALGRPELVERGLELLRFLVETETSPSGWLSPTASEGRAPGDRSPLWDQQAIEPAAIADACLRASEVTGDVAWLEGARLALEWFLGSNDTGMPMVDVETGAGYDGLQPKGRNTNRGAESTLAALSTFQLVGALGLVPAS